MDLPQDKQREFFERLGEDAWTVVYDSQNTESHDVGVYCALSEPSRRTQALGDGGWDLTITDGAPGFSQSWPDGVLTTTYHPSGSLDGLEPLVLVREFYGASPSTVELDQQFRLFHNLRHDPDSGNYFKMLNDGTQTPAVRVEGRKISIRTPLLRQYIAARQMDLLLFIDSKVFSTEPADLPEKVEYSTDRLVGLRYYGDLDYRDQVFSRFLATKVIAPGPVETCGIWPYEAEDKNFPEFIIGEDEQGRHIMHTCDPDALADYFGKNPGSPHYLTPVHFRKEVLQKYYAKPELYSVEDGYLRCAALWGLQMDNDHEDRVVVFLGDLCRDLPSAERDYWRGYMMAPDAKMSATNFKRAFLAEPTDPEALDLRFRRLYQKANDLHAERYGWPLFREPKESDVYLLQQLRLPLNDSQNEFEEALKLLAKLMSDAMNEKEVQKQLTERVEGDKGISKLARYLAASGYPEVTRDIAYLRKVQELRSRVTAHLKGSDYEKALTKNLGVQRGREAIRTLFEEGITLLETMVAWVQAVPKTAD